MELELRNRSSPGPSVVLIVFDDMGLGDLGVYGSRAIQTPHIDALARDNVWSRSFYAGASVCSPSRATLLTGRLPPRTGVGGLVLFPNNHPLDLAFRLIGYARGLLGDEITLASALRAAGWRTEMVGKWHLGGVSPHLPTDHGFDAFHGVLHSNDMAPFELWQAGGCAGTAAATRCVAAWTRLAERAEQPALISEYTNASVRALERAAAADEPIFLYVAHNAPHDPLYVRASRPASRGGLYGAVVEELDESVGSTVGALRRLGRERDTLLLLTSDNGPWYEGSAAGLRERKASAFEGGFRVPFVVSWPAGGVGPARRPWSLGSPAPEAHELRAPIQAADIFRTVLSACNVAPPADRRLDGRDLLPLLRAPDQYDCAGRGPEGAAAICERPLRFFSRNSLAAVRVGSLKLHLPHLVRPDELVHHLNYNHRALNYNQVRPDELVRARTLGTAAEAPRDPECPWMWLTDLEVDPEEALDASAAAPEAARKMACEAASWQAEFHANVRGRVRASDSASMDSAR